MEPHRPHPRIFRVQDGPAVPTSDPDDRALHLGQLVEGVDPVQPEVVGADVGDHRDVVVLVADATQEDPATGRLEDGEVEIRLGEDPTGPAEPGPVPSLDQLAADVDPVRVGHAHPQTGSWPRRGR